MTDTRNYTAIWIVLCLMVVGLLALAVLPTSTQAGPDLPSRDTPTPARADDEDEDDDGPAGAHIELSVAGAPAGAWSVVQWADNTGTWHDVEGWRGTLDQYGNRRWWVHPSHFRAGPFRWLVMDGPEGQVISTSETFHLPTAPGELVLIEVSAGQ
jgi:hypothetical protein